MGTPRFTPEFKEEAVRQITERGYLVEATGTVETHRRRAGYPEKSRVVLCKGVQLKYHFINEYRSVWCVMAMCRVLNVAHTGFYAWLHHPVCARDKDNQHLLMLNAFALTCRLDADFPGHCWPPRL